MSSSGRSRWLIGLYAAASLLWLAPLMLHPGACPFGLQDWALFPCFDEQRFGLLHQRLLPWTDSNLGAPSAAPYANMALAIVFALSALAPQLALRGFLFAIALCGTLGMDRLLEQIFGVRSPLIRALGALLYLGSPFWAIKLVAGHVVLLFAAALLPWAFLAFEAAANYGGRAWAACCLYVAAILAQIQVAAVLLASLPILAWGKLRARVWVSMWVVALVLWAPTIYAGWVAFLSSGLRGELQLASWVQAQSISPMRVFDGTAYFANYYERVAGVAPLLLWRVVGLVGFVCALLFGGRARGIVIAALIACLCASGTRGPLGPFVARLVETIPAAAVFREFYDLLVLVPIVVAAGIAVGLQRLIALTRTQALRNAVVIVAGAGAMVLLLPTFEGSAAAMVPLSDVGAWRAEAREAALANGEGRALWLPAWVPVGPAGTPGGADPFEIPFGSRSTVQAYHPSGLFAYETAIADLGARLPVPVLARMGVDFVGVRAGIVSHRLAIAAHPIRKAVSSQPSRVELVPRASALAVAQRAACEPDLRSELRADMFYRRCGNRALFVPEEASERIIDDPAREWVDAERWGPLDPQLLAPRWPVVFTTGRSAFQWALRTMGFTLIYAPGHAMLDGRPFRATGWKFERLRAGTHLLRGDGGIVALSATVVQPEHGDAGSKERILAGRSTAFYTYRATLPPASGARFVVLRQSWSPYWRATLDGLPLAEPMLADGYAAAWALPPNARGELVIRYGANVPYLIFCAVSAAMWFVLLALAMGPRRRSIRAE